MVENNPPPLLPRNVYLARLAKSGVIAFLLICGSLAIGVFGYMHFGNLPWVDAFLNASMILAGMGPVDTMTTQASKLFSALYALFSGVAFLTIVGLLLAPVVHRVLHSFHLASEEDATAPRPKRASKS